MSAGIIPLFIKRAYIVSGIISLKFLNNLLFAAFDVMRKNGTLRLSIVYTWKSISGIKIHSTKWRI